MRTPAPPPRLSSRRRTAGAIALAGVLVVVGTVVWRQSGTQVSDDQAGRALAAATFVGTATCATCHQAQHQQWQESQHRKAMEEATPASVLGNFATAGFTALGATSTFSRKGDEFWVRTDGATGALEDFRVKYTYGIFPLQQYLIETPGGRLQALSVAWDARARAQGGQRWYHLYPDERIDHRDELHWTGRQQNWNFMCADCHSTNVRKGYDLEKDQFATSWTELNVACEACHGPGSRHQEWAAASPAERRAWSGDNGLTAQLVERRGVTWSIGSNGNPVRSAPRAGETEIEQCAQCHARRAQVTDGYVAGARFDDFYAASTLEPRLYFPDGQQRDEVYTYGSFLQSRMHQAGVTCSDCHDPHSATLRAEGNALCTTCHVAQRYAAPAHHFHAAGSTGSTCVSCHMPARTYMGIDARRDHSFRVPRPDESVTLGTPNACTDCHRDRPARWAADRIRQWHGRDAKGFQTFATAFHADEANVPSADRGLLAVANDADQPPIVRASALERLGRYPSPESAASATRALGDGHPLVRRSALRAMDGLPSRERLMAVPLLADQSRAVRLEAVRVLAPVHTSIAGVAERAALNGATSEFIASQRFNADRPEARLNLGSFFAQLGRESEAIAEYRAAIRLAPAQVPAYVNLADLQSRQADEAAADRTLREGLSRAGSSADLHHALGLSLARSKRIDEATAELGRAASLAPEVARFAYAHAVALNSAGRGAEAIRAIERARTRHPRDRDLLVALATFQRDAGRTAEALRAAEELVRVSPGDPEAQELRRSLAPASR